jgi:L-asparagine transporter-like permease
MLAFIMFAFGGIELIGMAAAEAMIQRKRFLKRLTKLCPYFGFLCWLISNPIITCALEPT